MGQANNHDRLWGLHMPTIDAGATGLNQVQFEANNAVHVVKSGACGHVDAI